LRARRTHIIPPLVESVNPLAESTIPAATSPRKLTPDYASSPACPGASLNLKPFGQVLDALEMARHAKDTHSGWGHHSWITEN
jgi:hypothetical protein